MTTVPMDAPPAAEAKPALPVAVLALAAATGLVTAGHAALSIAYRGDSPVWNAWPTAVMVAHLLAIVAVVGLTVWAFRGLTAADPGPAQPLAALARYAVLFNLVTLACSWTLDHRLGGDGAGEWVVRLVRAAVLVGLPVATLLALARSGPSKRAYGENIGARLGDFLLTSLTRDGALSILVMLAALLLVLGSASLPSMAKFGTSFLTGREWRAQELPGAIKLDADKKPVIEDGEVQREAPVPVAFGALPVIYGTAVSSALALLVAVPLSFGAALFLVRISPDLRPLVVRAAVCGLLLVLVAVRVAAGTGGTKFADDPGRLAFVLLVLVVTIAVAELIVFAANRLLGTLQAGQPVPWAWDLAAHALLAVLAVAFALVYFPGTGGKAALVGLLAAAVLYPVATYFTPTVSFLIEFLAAIPSLAYGMWGMWVLALFLQSDVEPVLVTLLKGFGVGIEDQPVGRDMLCGGLILGIMIIPIITAISRDVLRAVPGAQVEGTTALGATWWQSSVEMLKFSRSALFGAVMLGLARAAGETMAVTMVIGNNAQIKASLLAPAQTMASLLANEFGEAGPGSLHFSALMYVAFILLVMSLAFNVVARYFVVGKGARTSAAH